MSSLCFLAPRTCRTHGSRVWVSDSTLCRSLSQHASRPVLQPRIQSTKRFGLGGTDDASHSEHHRRSAAQSRVPSKRKSGFGIREESPEVQSTESEHSKTPVSRRVGDSRSSFGIQRPSSDPDYSERRGSTQDLRAQSTDVDRETTRSTADLAHIEPEASTSRRVDAAESSRSQQVAEEKRAQRTQGAQKEPWEVVGKEQQPQQWSAPPMGWGAKKSQIEIFHNPDDPVSCKVLGLLDRARTQSFPPKSQRALEPKPVKRRIRGGPTHIMPPPPPPPLLYSLTVTTDVPTAYAFHQLMEMMTDTAASFTKAFIKPTVAGYNVNPTNANDLHELAMKDKGVLKWPIVVCWPMRWCAVGSYKEVYSFLRKQADRRPLPKLEGTPIWDLDALAKAREANSEPAYLKHTFSEAELAELEEITS